MKQKKFIKSKYILLFFVVICLMMVMFSLLGKKINGLNTFLGRIITPVEKVITKVGDFFSDNLTFFDDKETLIAENQILTIKNKELKNQISSLEMEVARLEGYKDLYDLDQEYEEYNKVAANVIAKDSGNWFYSFTIDKGTDDGIKEGMNVLSGSGLVGKIVSVGNNWAQVRSIVDSTSYVSAMVVTTGDYGIVSGSLELAEDGCAQLEQFYDSDNNAAEGDMLVTSNISDVYWPGLLIGYISKIQTDTNNLTKTGEVVLAADFEHITNVLVITDMKEEIQN